MDHCDSVARRQHILFHAVILGANSHPTHSQALTGCLLNRLEPLGTVGRTLISSVLRQILGVWFGFPCYPQTAEAYRDLRNFKFQPVAVWWSLLISGALFVIFPAASADGSGSLGISALVQRLVEVEFPSKKQIETYWKKLKHIEAECGACAKQSLRVCQSVWNSEQLQTG